MASPRQGGRRRPRGNTFTTRSGATIKVHQSFSERVKSNRDMRARRRASRLATLPKGRVKRLLYQLRPKHLVTYWFSRDGAIMALKVVGVGIVVVFIVLIGLFAYFRKDLPKLTDISGDNIGGSITYYDRTGNTVLWQDYNAVKRVTVTGNQISPYMKQATIAVEDKNFYHEGAFSFTGIARAALHDALSGGGGGLQGGSTITQQVVKLNEQWTTNRTITRKIKEIILAVDLEREYSKDNILIGYLNLAPYGGVDYGVQTAARDYFGVDASQLSLAQAAMLAAIPKSPTYYSPYSDPQYNPAVSSNEFGQQALLSRKDYVLDQMAKQGYITQDQATQAKQVNVLGQVHPLQAGFAGIKAPYFVLTAKRQLENKYGATTVKRGGWKVITTLDMNLQNAAEQLVAKNLANVSRYGADEEAVVGEDVQTGQIVSLVGGTDFFNKDHGQDNYASGILIPPGSSFKPYDYATLINNHTNVGAGSVLYDSKGPIPGYEGTCPYPPNISQTCPGGTHPFLYDYDFLFPGPLTLRYAIGGSRNIPAVKAMLEALPSDTSPGHTASINKVIDTASAMMDNPYQKRTYNCYSDVALTQPQQCYGASAIGDGAFLHLDDHVNGLSTLARLGAAIPTTYILKITDANNSVVDQFTQPKPTQALQADSAYIINSIASDPNASYLPGSCSSTTCTPLSQGGFKFQRDHGWNFAVKTGTTTNGFDGLMTSWSTKYAVVSWVGNHTRNVTLHTSMEYLTEPLTRGWMEAAHANLQPVGWTAPSDMKSLPAFVVRNHVHFGDIEPSPTNDLFPSWYVPKPGTTTATIDKVSGNLATNCTPALAKQTVGGGNDNLFSVDIFYPPNQSSTGTTTTTATSDTIHNCNDTPPSITLTQNSCGDSSHCDFTATTTQGTNPLAGGAYTTAPAGTISLIINGQPVQTMAIPAGATSPYSVTFSSIPITNGQTVEAQVADSVLYSGTSTVTVNDTVPATPAANPPNQNQNNH